MDEDEDEDAPLTGIALTIWRDVVCGGEHLEVNRDGRRVAVVLPAEDFDAMTARAEGGR